MKILTGKKASDAEYYHEGYGKGVHIPSFWYLTFLLNIINFDQFRLCHSY